MNPKKDAASEGATVLRDPAHAVRAILMKADGTVVATVENVWPEVIYRVIDFAMREVDGGTSCTVQFEPIYRQ